MKTVSENAAFGGVQGVYCHASDACGCEMTFAVYLPPQARHGQGAGALVPVGADLHPRERDDQGRRPGLGGGEGIAVIFPDTSPRGEGVADDPAYDLGQGAGLLRRRHRRALGAALPHVGLRRRRAARARVRRAAARPRAPGDHRALDGRPRRADHRDDRPEHLPLAVGDLADRQPDASDWGRKQLGAYLGRDEAAWAAHDATLLMRERGYPAPILVDQGANDQFLDLLKPEALVAAAAERRQPMQFRMIEGYDHSYFYVASVMEDHVRWHAANSSGHGGPADRARVGRAATQQEDSPC